MTDKKSAPMEFWICRNPIDPVCTDAHVYDNKPIWFDDIKDYHVIEKSYAYQLKADFDSLVNWKKQMEMVTEPIFSFEHPEMKLGESKVATIINFVRERDSLKQEYELHKLECKPLFSSRVVIPELKAKIKELEIDHNSWQNCQQKLKDANERIVEFESIKKAHVEYCDKIEKEKAESERELFECQEFLNNEGIESLRADLDLALKYLAEGKAKFTPNTTNSMVDHLLDKYGKL